MRAARLSGPPVGIGPKSPPNVSAGHYAAAVRVGLENVGTRETGQPTWFVASRVLTIRDSAFEFATSAFA
jgi:hypothetical protein